MANRKSQITNRKWLSAPFWVLAAVHRGAAWVLRLAGRALGRALAPFPWSCRFGAMSALMGIVAIYLGMDGLAWLLRVAQLSPKDVKILGESGILQSFEVLSVLAILVGLVLVACALLAFVRHWLALLLLKIGGAGFAVVWAYLLVFLVRAPSILYTADAKSFDKIARNELWVAGVWMWVPGALVSLAFLTALVLRPVSAFYRGRRRERETLGDRVVANLKTQGGDPRFRTSSYWSALAHLSVLFLIPLLMRGCGMEEAYGVPKGSGNPVVQVVRIKRIKKPKKKEKFVLNMNSPIIFYRPDIDESGYALPFPL